MPSARSPGAPHRGPAALLDFCRTRFAEGRVDGPPAGHEGFFFLLALAHEKVDSFAVDLEDLKRELSLG